MKSDTLKLEYVVVRGKNEWLLEVFMSFGICNQTKLVRFKFFFYKIGLFLKNGSFFYKIGLKRGIFSKPGWTN